MKALACSLAVVLSIALSSGIAVGADEYVITGTIVEVDTYGSGMTIETAKKERYDIDRDPSQRYATPPKVGAKVTVHYRVTPRGKAIAIKIEKAESGSQKNRQTERNCSIVLTGKGSAPDDIVCSLDDTSNALTNFTKILE